MREREREREKEKEREREKNGAGRNYAAYVRVELGFCDMEQRP